jgi:hypothetical protein
MSEKYKECLKESARHLQIADHMTYITFPLVNEKKLIIKIFEEIFKSVKNSVNSAIYFEFQNKNLILSNNEKENIDNFIKNLAKEYDLNEKEINKIREIIEIEKKHEESSMEFIRKEKLIMMSDSLDIKTITIEDIKEYLTIAKNLFLKISKKNKTLNL